ncbi:MAG: PilZ domain-containing protein [Candidatus Omnitrophica bacterium]|nr:PilZ domain-containing protein [Candidatus Omnitrophota bacterium]
MRLFIVLLFLFVFAVQANAQEIITQDERAEIIKRLGEMDKALTRIEDTSIQEIKTEVSNTPQVTVEKDSLLKASPDKDKTSEIFVPVGSKNISNEVENPVKENLLPETKISSPIVSSVKSRSISLWIFLLAGLALFSGLGVLIIRYLKNKWKTQFDSELIKVKSRLREKEERLNQEEIIRKAIEQAQVQKEKDYNQLKSSFEFLQSELERKNEVLAQKEAVIEEEEQNSLQKEQECGELKKIIEALKDALVKRKIMGKSLSSQESDKPWISGESAERRELGRLDLSRDYSRSALLRIDSQDKSKTAKCFAGNISLGGLYCESEAEFHEKEILRLRLFFFGDKVPMMRVKAEVIWVKKSPAVNYYGLSLLFQEENNQAELKEYIESHMVKSSIGG